MKKKCESCRWYAYYEGTCCNGDSEFVADFRGFEDICEFWEDDSDMLDGVYRREVSK